MFTPTIIDGEASNKTSFSFRRELIIYGSPKRYPIFYIKGSVKTITSCNYKDTLIWSTSPQSGEVINKDEIEKHAS